MPKLYSKVTLEEKVLDDMQKVGIVGLWVGHSLLVVEVLKAFL